LPPLAIGLAFMPVVDGRTLPRRPLMLLRKVLPMGYPLLVGTNRIEMGLFTLMDPAEAVFKIPLPERLFGEGLGRW